MQCIGVDSGPQWLAPVGIGLSLNANWDALDLVQPLLDLVAFVEVAPETMWGAPPPREDDPAPLSFNAFADAVEDIARARGIRVAAHGLGLSPATVSRDVLDAAAAARWRGMIEMSQRRFDFLWYLDHLGFSRHGGCQAMLPLPPDLDDATVDAVRTCMDAIRPLNPFVGWENSVWYFSQIPPAGEPALLAAMARRSGAWLLLDVHNVFTQCVNAKLDWRTYVAGLPLDRVICIHISGGSMSSPLWLDGVMMRLDAHDSGVPDEVWEILEAVVPRCPNLRGIVLERMEGTFKRPDVPALADELRRARDVWDRSVGARVERVFPLYAAEIGPRDDNGFERAAARQALLIEAMQAVDPIAYLRQRGAEADWLAAMDADGVRLSSLLVQKLRFERLMRGDDAVGRLFEADVPTFVTEFERYQRAVPPTAFFPAEEARLWRGWRSESGQTDQAGGGVRWRFSSSRNETLSSDGRPMPQP